MKVSWGTKIAAFYISFVLFIIAMVYMAFGEKYDLVTENYYQQEIEFQDRIDKSANAFALDDKLKISLKDKYVVMRFPVSETEIKGKVHFFRPSDENFDFSEEISLNNETQKFNLNKFKKGKYLIKTEWTNGEKEFFQEDMILIP